jgi:hypothetical protein
VSNGLDLRPRVILHTTAGAVVITVDPTSAVTGFAEFPVFGSVPYFIQNDPLTPLGFNIVIDFPVGAVTIPINPSSLGGDSGPMEVPGLGPATYEVVIGPPNLSPNQLASPLSVAGAFLANNWLVVAGIGAVLFFLMRR